MVGTCVLMFPVLHETRVPYPAVFLFLLLALLECRLFNSPLSCIPVGH